MREDLFSGTGSGMLFIQARNEYLILDCIKAKPKAARQVAKEVGISSSTVYKLLNEFIDDEMVTLYQPDKRVKPKLYKLKEI